MLGDAETGAPQDPEVPVEAPGAAATGAATDSKVDAVDVNLEPEEAGDKQQQKKDQDIDLEENGSYADAEAIENGDRESSVMEAEREMTAVQFAKLVSKNRRGDHWPVHVGFRNLSYTVSVPKEDVGMTTVLTACGKLFQPLMKLARCGGSDRIELPILRDMSGAFEAGRATLVLGPPGCGVSTLFKALSGRLQTSRNQKLEGDILYSGFTPDELHVRKLSAYVPQSDLHLAVLNVRETLQFAYDCFGGPEMAHKLADASVDDSVSPEDRDTIRKQLEDYPNFIIDNLALTNAANTILGNDLLRGVSGGEKKRVTSAEIWTARRPLVFYDQISTGLDSAATFDINRRIVGIAKQLDLTPVVALLQPPPETYNLFDDILILATGHIVYHGAREDVLPYFESIGFKCPDDRDIADFIQEVTTDARMRYRTRNDVPTTDDALAQAWRASPYSQPQQDACERRMSPDNKVDSPLRRELFAKDAPIYANSFVKDFRLVFWRQWQLVLRDPAFIAARLIQALIMGVIIGTVFLDLDPNLPTDGSALDYTPVTNRYGVIFITLLQCGLAGFAQVPVVLEQRPVFYRQSGSYFYRTINYVLAETLTVFPIAVLESLIFSSLVFWISKLVPFGSDTPSGESDAVAAFFKFVVILLVLNLSFSAFLRALAAFAPTQAVGQTFAGICVAVCILYSGFIITTDVMKPWFGWIRFPNPIYWAFRACVLTVFTSTAFTPDQQAFALGIFSYEDKDSYYWGTIVLLMAYAVLNLGVSWVAYTWARHEGSGGRQTKISPTAEDTHNPDVAQAEIRKASELREKSSAGVGSEVHVRMATSLNNEHFVPVDLAFRDLWYSVPGPKAKRGEYNLDLLKGISGYAEAGTLTALMGSSGAGKSTLLDVLALRKTSGKTTGEVLVNGRPQEKVSFSRICGYVEQNDVHNATSTVEEALRFSAVLRQPKEVSIDDKLKFVESVLGTLQLDDIREFQVGHKDEGGLTVEQVKRLTIGVELAANPSMIFADEPTSGLDASSARIVMQGLERIARAGRTVVCTIHQPSKDIFTRFDRLLLLRRGGQMVYFGDLGSNSEKLLSYLTDIPGIDGMPNARYNPATYMLETIGSNAGKGGAVDFADHYDKSAVRTENLAKIDALVKSNLEQRPEIHFDNRFASDFGTQLSELFKRWMTAYYRNAGYNFVRMLVALGLALFFGLSFLDVGSDFSTTQSVQSLIGVLFVSVMFVTLIALNTAIPTLMDERAVFYRERASSYYSVSPMVISITFWETVYTVISSVLFTVPFFFLCGFYVSADAFFGFFGVFLLLQLAVIFLGHCFAVVCKNEQVASITGALLFSAWGLTSSLMIAVPNIIWPWRVLAYINPFQFALRGLVVSQLGCTSSSPADAPGCQYLDVGSITAWEYLQANFGFKDTDLALSLGVLAAFAVALRVITIWAYVYVSFLRR